MTVVYRLFDSEDDLIYIGVTDNLPQRLADHRARSRMRGKIARVELVEFATRDEALRAENAAIRTEYPRFNAMFNDRPPSLTPESNPVLWAKAVDAVMALGAREDALC